MGHVVHFHGRTGLSGTTDYGQTSDSAEQYFCSSLNEDFAQVSALFEGDENVELFMPSNITTLIHDYDDKGIFDEFDFATTFDGGADYENWKESFVSRDIYNTPLNQVDYLTVNKEDSSITVNASKAQGENQLFFDVELKNKLVEEKKSCLKPKLEESTDVINISEICPTDSRSCKNNYCESESISNFTDCVSFNTLQTFEAKTIETDCSHRERTSAKVSSTETTVFAPTIADKVKRGRKRQSGVDCYHEIGMIIQQHENRKRRKRKNTDLNKTHEHVFEQDANSSYTNESSCWNKEDNVEQSEVFLRHSGSSFATDNSCQSFQNKIKNSYVCLELPYKNMRAKVENSDYFSQVSCSKDSIKCHKKDQDIKNQYISHSLPLFNDMPAHAMLANTDSIKNYLEGNNALVQSGRIMYINGGSTTLSYDSHGCDESQVSEPVEISTPDIAVECQDSRPLSEIICLKTDTEGLNINIEPESSSASFIIGQKNIFEKDNTIAASSEINTVHSRHSSTSSTDSRSSHCHSISEINDSTSSSYSNMFLKAQTSCSQSNNCDKSKKFAINSMDENLHNESVKGHHSDHTKCYQNMKNYTHRNRSRSRSSSPHHSKHNHRRLSQSKSSLCDKDSRKSRSRSRSRECKYSSKERSPSCRNGRYYKDHCKAIEERRIIYVGNIPEGFTVEQLKSRFHCFGPILDAQIKSKNENNCREKSIFGFITFKNRRDAYNAFERGNEQPLWPKFDINFGGRRRFCNGDYTDLDGKVAERENVWYSSHLSKALEQSEGDDFAELLKAEEMRLGIKRRQIHTK